MKGNFSSILLWALITVFLLPVKSQNTKKYSHADTLKGRYSKERAWWDVVHYDLHTTFSPVDSSVWGFNHITFSVLEAQNLLQIDLMRPMVIDSIRYGEKYCQWTRDGDAWFVTLPETVNKGELKKLKVYFHGKPHVAVNPPWDGGVIWAKDKKAQPWISIACQGMAAQVWFPNKDHMRDEPDSADIYISCPKNLIAVSNGRLKEIDLAAEKTATFHWKVKNPINNYNIIPYIGKYSNFKDTLTGEAGVLDLDYWVLEENYGRAKQHFQQVKPMLRCFEYWFGPYPFYSDGYKLVEAPFLGMEHQSAIAYGNNYQQAYMGRDMSNTGWGLKWDFIIVHESGHEWFGNNISAQDVADNWIHESFTSYAENLYTEYLFGKKAGADYVIGTRLAIANDKPIISDYNVNAGGSIDLYFKGANMLHTMRQIVNNDSLWRQMLRHLNQHFRHQTVTTQQIESYLSSYLHYDFQKIFDQYLRTTKIPQLEYRIQKGKLKYRWSNCVKGFNMPVKIELDPQNTLLLSPSEKWQSIPFKGERLSVDRNFYVSSKNVQ